MQLKTIERDGWEITNSEKGYIFLTYSPDVLGELGACYLVDKNVYDRALDENINLKQLINEFYIFSNYRKVYDIKKPPKLPPKINTPTKYYHKGDFIATQEGEKYFLEYQLAYHGGGSRKIPVSKEAYLNARTGKYSTSDLFKKYNLYHLDIPENDVK